MKKLYIVGVCLLVIGSLLGGVAFAKPFYEGKVITLIVATGPGSGYDVYGRLVAQGMEKQLPGSTIIVKNVPGAGHILGTNEISRAKPNGLTFGTFNKGLIGNQIVGKGKIRFDLAKMSWLGSAASEGFALYLSTRSSFKTLEDVMRGDKMFVTAGSGIGSINVTFAKLMEYMGVLPNQKAVTGYSSAEAAQAMIAGDIDGWMGSYSTLKALDDSGDAKVILLIGQDPEVLAKDPDMPLLRKVVRDPAKHARLLGFMDAQLVLGRPFAGPPGIPQDRLQILREAFKKALQDPELLAIAKKAGIPIDHMSGEKAQEIVKDALEQPPELVGVLKRVMGVKD